MTAALAEVPSVSRPSRFRHDVPAITVQASSREAAQRQFWRHVANRACLAILADVRHPLLTSRTGSTNPTLGPDEPAPALIGSDIFQVRVEPIEIHLPDRAVVTQPLRLDMLVWPTTPGTRLTLDVVRDWPTPKTTEPLFKYRSHLQTFERQQGLSGDVVYLFELLLYPHAGELLHAMRI